MKKIVLAFLIIGQILMAAKIEYIDVKGIKIPLIYEEDKRLPIVTTQIIFTDSGSITDIKKAGLAKFSSKILNEGTKKLGSIAFSEALESKAIHLSASCATETFVLELSSLKDEFDNGVKYLDILLRDPNYSNESMQKVKIMTIGSISRNEDNFDYLASKELKSILFEGSVLAKPSSGTIDSVESIKLNDVKAFIKEHLVLSRAIVLVGGDISIKDIKRKLGAVLKNILVGKSVKLPYILATKKAKEVVLKKETQQAYIYFGSPYNMRVNDENYYKARVATFILGTGGFGSRLMEEIRVKRGLAYSAYARVHVSNSSSYMSGYLQTKLDSMDEAKKTVINVIDKFVKDGVSEEELEQTKRFILGSEPLRVETMSQRLNRTFMDYYKGFGLNHSEKELKKIENLKLKDLNEFIKEHKEILDMSFAIVTK